MLKITALKDNNNNKKYNRKYFHSVSYVTSIILQALHRYIHFIFTLNSPERFKKVVYGYIAGEESEFESRPCLMDFSKGTAGGETRHISQWR